MTGPKPNFAVSADETPYRRLAATIREDIYRYGQASYMFGVQAHTGLVDAAGTRAALAEQRNRIYSKMESLLMLIDMMGEMKDVNVNAKLTPTRNRSHKKTVTEPVDPPAPAPRLEVMVPLPVQPFSDDPIVNQIVTKLYAEVEG